MSARSQDRSPAGGSQVTRKRPSHIVGDGQVLKRRKQHAHPLRREDVTIQIGSQERRLGDTSSIVRSRGTQSARDSHPGRRLDVKLSNAKRAQDGPKSTRLPSGASLLRSSLPMREPSTDRSESGEQGCCVSSDADGRILATSFPRISHPVSIRPVPESLFHLDRFDSENTGTAIAQVGRAIAPVASSQKAENARWHEWLAQSTSPISSHVAIEGSGPSLDHRVSPGVSEIPPPKQKQSTPSPRPGGSRHSEPDHRTPRASQDHTKLLSSSDLSELLARCEEAFARLRRQEQFDPTGSDKLPRESAVATSTENSASSIEGHEEQIVSLSSSPDQDGSMSFTEVGNQGHAINGHSNTDSLGPEHTRTNGSSSRSPLVVQQNSPESEGVNADEAWKTFVFGDENSDEVGKAVFEEAKHDAARQLQPSTSPTPPDVGHESDGQSNVATVGTLHTGHDNETSGSAGTSPTSGAAESLSAVYDDSPAGSESASAAGISRESIPAPSIEVNAGTSDVSGQASTTYTSEGGEPSVLEETESCTFQSIPAPSIEVNAGTSDLRGQEDITNPSGTDEPTFLKETESSTSQLQTGAPSMTTSMVVAPARSNVGPSETDTTGEHFRFAQPKPFVGSRSSLAQPKTFAERGVGISLTKKRRGRRKKRANDGRADIRALPNYNSDPIEEFDEEARPFRGGRAPKSLFPALELS